MTIAQDAIPSEDAATPSSSPPSPTARPGSWLHALLIDGPDVSTQGSFWDTLLNWPARWLLVLGLTLVGLIWARFPLGVQLGWALNYGLLAGVSIASSVWVWLMVVNLALAGLWLLSSWRRPLSVAAERSSNAGSASWDISDSITWLNRQVGHIEALAVWTALAFVNAHELTWQLLGFSALLLLAEPCLNGLARWELKRQGQPAAPHAAVMIARRKWIYAATLVGFFWLSMLAWRQTLTLVPLFLTVLPGIVLRLVRAALRKRQINENETRGQTRLALAEKQRRAAPVTDALFGPGLALVMTAALCVGSFLQQQQLRGRAAAKPPTTRENSCIRDLAGPATPTLAVMLLADSQVHTLGGARFPGQLELADTLVPVALRPVELDMLSSAATTRVAQVYRKRKQQREQQHLAPPLWAHLGDFADLGCADEMNRALRVLEQGFGAGPLLAGLAPGNHDSNFTGDFAWSPFWDSACDPSAGEAANPGRLDKPRADRWLARLLPGVASTAGARASGAPLSESTAIAGFTVHWPFYQEALARITVTHLGLLPAADGAAPRGVVAVFLDSSDRRENDYGIPGEFGALSAKQVREVHASIAHLEATELDRGPWNDPWFVLFMHHPYDELTGPSRDNFDDLVKALNHDGSRASARVLALISAHTHTAASAWHDVGSHKLREVVVGSVIDPPQQAAWLEIGIDAQGQAALRVSTLPTVARAGRVCSGDDSVDAGVCQRAMAQLAGAPECRALLADGTEDTSCEKLERTLSLSERLDALTVTASVDNPIMIRADQDKRASALLQCITRPSSQTCPPHPVDPTLLEHPLANEAYAPVIEALAADDCQPSPAEPSRQQELTCLAWAAAAVQAHKANGMTMASAIRCAFDDPGLPAAQVSVATEER